MKNTLIAADNSLILWAFIMISVAVAIMAEQRFKWASKIPGSVLALLIAVSASNLHIIPTEAPVYDAIWGYVLPLSIPLLLFKTNFQRIIKESGRLLILFLISSIATMIGAIVSFHIFKSYIPELDKISGMMAASYTGGGVNFVAMSAKLGTSQDMVASAIIADNFMMAGYFIILITLSGWAAARKFWGSPYADKVEKNPNLDKFHTLAEAYWQPKSIALKDIALSLAWSIFIVALSFHLAAWLKALLGQPNNIYQELLFSLITDKYLLLTTTTFILVSIFKETFSKLNGTQELGTYAIYMFFVVIGIPTSIHVIISQAPLLFAFVFVIAMLNLILTFAAGKMFKFSLEENILACNANIGGPTTAAAMAISRGWVDLVGPIMVIGTVGYVIGNYVGTFVYFVVG
ncbi:DUF819 domain-containing protein [Xenorhabdus sp. 12]|uniref:DUF819 domain-containing protein n=1 Tax=Xenorhabdus santafensis TaxID=2582833 RepID=A0ABU4S7S6_9GAMM|nr:DUF819 family protein [Xenorhabdus sp. 12]MDX7986836.1 DUF819 domain-containing protein [Xenorhabdus sp. 12]